MMPDEVDSGWERVVDDKIRAGWNREEIKGTAALSIFPASVMMVFRLYRDLLRLPPPDE